MRTSGMPFSQALADSGRTVVRTTGEQVNGFAGNVLEGPQRPR